MGNLRVAIAAIWLIGAIAAVFYARAQQIPAWVAVPVGIAFLIEISLYATLGRAVLRKPWQFLLAALAPYLVYSLATGVFASKHFLLLLVLCSVLSWWLALIPSLDLVFMAVVAAVQITVLYRDLYPPPWPDLKVHVLGHLMLFRTAMGTMLEFRGDGCGFGFFPGREHWKTGLRYFAYLAPAALAVNWAVGFAQPRLVSGFWWKAPGTFVGILWVVALGEEFLFRGTLLPRLAQRIGTTWALIASSIAFGSVHLWASAFPNWRFAVVAAVAGMFYGWAYLATGSIRSAMVTHALTVTMWRTFFAIKAGSAL
ncbi:MAG: CPBP family intramembrane glutamic endopeptidase [Bryobacteraceae bacterium]